ncbi:Glutathione import ATP-binding protein GsiA [Geodia barretti]|uniref:Glutathione import ATP-binding protein GsiA n=2 Tax=Geodia barretti TaxID=519541 RepID=A0AA35W630_GEOBA|nr:Glutathione import ATP-binding protein GsiA [Geodia barretti]
MTAVQTEAETILEVKDLYTYIFTRNATVKAVDGISFTLHKGETLGIVGESGCGKTMTALSLLRLVPRPAGKIVGGEVILNGEDVLLKSEDEMRDVRGRQISMILQDPQTSLNPVFTIGNQLREALGIAHKENKRSMLGRAVGALRSVNVAAPERRLDDYPHQMSGGMKQRVVGAIAMSCEPGVIIADEPTTALDVTIQLQYLRLLKDIQAETGLAIIFITHDFGVVARMCDRVAVMYAGRIIEQGNVRDIFNAPSHPYTQALINSVPKERLLMVVATNENLLEVRGLKKYFPVTKGLIMMKTVGYVQAVDGISFNIKQGETVGLVGESGCGKTTTSKLLLRLEVPTEGEILLEGQDISGFRGAQLQEYRTTVQAVFQDPWSSLSPRMRVRDIVAEPLIVNRNVTTSEKNERVAEVLNQVGLHPEQANNYPHEFSGGQRQRIAVASALVSYPKLIILDEPVSALDVSIRAQVMNLLKDLQEQYNVSYLLIAHNLATVRYMAHQTAVMYLGQIVEYADTEELYENALHPYTKALFSAALPSHPDMIREDIVLQGEVPSPINPPTGCRFHPRCPFAMPQCSEEVPVEKEVSPGHRVSCHLY